MTKKEAQSQTWTRQHVFTGPSAVIIKVIIPNFVLNLIVYN